MPLSETNELNLIMNENAKLTVEHSGGDGWTILHGDMLNLMRSFESGVFDAGHHRPALCQRRRQSDG